MKSILNLVIISTLLCFKAGAATIFVRPGATGNGTSWANATGNLRTSIANASAGDMIWVAQGTYRAASNTNTDSSFILKNGVAVYGGFLGTELSLSQRADTSGVTTILSGDLGGGARSKHVVTGPANLTNTTILDGFTISGGSVSEINPVGGGGAGIYSSGSPTLSHLIIENNTVNISVTVGGPNPGGGAGLYNGGGNPLLNLVTFRNNVVNITSISNPGTIAGGGGMFSDAGAPVISRTRFISNKVLVNGFIGAGGGFYSINNGAPVFINVIFSFNKVSSTNTTVTGNRGGGICLQGNSGSTTSAQLTNVLFEKDTANDGSALHITLGNAIVTNATFAGNSDGSYFQDDDVIAYFCNLTMYNSVVDGRIKNSSAVSLALNNSWIGLGISSGTYTGINSTLYVPVQFVDIARGNYNLMPCSIGVNAGDDTRNNLPTDVFGRPRKYGVIDMGALEIQRPTSVPDTIYVKAGSVAATADGASWGTAFPDLLTGINYACNTTQQRQIWVAQGTYLPSYIQYRDDRFTMTKNLKLYGGFAGNETRRDQRDSTGATNVTILSGELQGDNDSTNNSKTVVYASGLDSTAELNGVTVADGFGGSGNTGAGIYSINNNAIFRNLIVTNNSGTVQGGGMACYNSAAVIDNVTFRRNQSGMGGGLYCENGTIYGGPYQHASIRNSRFIENRGGFAGGMYCREMDVKITDVVFQNNRAVNYGGGLMNDIGSPVLTHVKFVGNETTDLTPIANSGGGMYSDAGGSPVLNDVLFTNNKSNYGGGLYLHMTSGNTTLNNVTFSGNSSYIKGNSIYYYTGNIAIRNTIFDTVANNRGNLAFETTATNMAIYNSMFRGAFPTGFTNGGTNILNTDPLFVDPANGDYSLKSCSPAINAGNNSYVYPGNTTDLAKNPRFFSNGLVDLGAYEFQGANTTPFVINTHPQNTTVSPGGNASFSTTVSGLGVTYQWQVSMDNGSTWTNIAGATSGTYNVSVTAAMNGYKYRCIVNGCPVAQTTNVATLTIKAAGINAVNNQAGTLTIFPNPAMNETNVNIELNNGSSDGRIVLADLTGRTLAIIPAKLQQGKNEVLVDLNSYATGVYLISAYAGATNETLIGTIKLVKQ